MFSTVGGYHDKCGDIMINVGDILSTVGVFSTVGGYHEYRGGGYLEYRGGCSVPWGDIMMHMGGYHDAHGGYHEYRGGCSVPWGEKSIVI